MSPRTVALARYEPARGTTCFRRWLLLSAWLPLWFSLVGADALLAATATLYKCTTAAGTLIYSDRPCTPQPGAAAAADDAAGRVTGQQVLQQHTRSPGPRLPSAASVARRCDAPQGREMTLAAAMAQAAGEKYEILKNIAYGLALSPYSGDVLSTLKVFVDDQHTLVLCPPASAPRLPIYVIEPNDRIVELSHKGRVKVMNDANDPITLADRCSGLVNQCFDPHTSGHSTDACFAAAAACPQGQLDPAARCCPQVCKEAYQAERAAGTDPLTASSRVLFGDQKRPRQCTLDAIGG
jgi:hypothetical protein